MGSVLVLDLDETLLLAVGANEFTAIDSNDFCWQNACHDAAQACLKHWPQLTCTQSSSYFMFIRPHAVAFLQYCRKQFDLIVIFTAGTQSHADHIHTNLFQLAAGISADFVFHRESCGKFAEATNNTTTPPDSATAIKDGRGAHTTSPTTTTLVQFQKNLCHLREQIELQASDEQRAKIDWSDCLYIDDLAMHATNNCGEMLIVPKFDYPCLRDILNPKKTANVAAMHEAANDETLLKLMHFIHAKVTSSCGVVWQQVDKRFALFC